MAEPLTINVQAAATAAPAVYTVPGSTEIEPLAAFASYDGTAAAGPWLPSLAIYSTAGLLISRVFPQGVTLGTGSTADVSFSPFSGGAGSSSSSGSGAELDYVELTTTLVVTSVYPAEDLFIQGNPLVFDGATRVLIEVWAPYMDVSNAAASKSAVLTLYEDGTEIGWLVNLESPSSVGAGKLSETVSGRRYMTPTAGTHTYSIHAWKNAAGTTADIGARPGGAGDYFPAFYRVSVA